jgi:acyl carrier protein
MSSTSFEGVTTLAAASTEKIERRDLLTQLMNVTAEALKADTVDPNVPLPELGIDSLNIVEVIIACEEIYGEFRIDPSNLEFDEMTSLLDMHRQMISFPLAA